MGFGDPYTAIVLHRNMAGDLGVEPRNAGIKIRCLNQLGESPFLLLGAVDGNRTRDLILTKDVRYQLRYNSDV